MAILDDILRFVEDNTGHGLNRDEFLHRGERSAAVRGATVCWMASPEAIRAAGEARDDLLICHESFYYPYDVVNLANPPAGWQKWRFNTQRRELLDRYDLACVRLHGSVDEISVFDSFARLLELGDPVYVNGLVRVFEMAECSFADLVARVKKRLNLPAIRVTDIPDPERKVGRVGLPWGGLGLAVNVSYQQRLIECGCDVFIAGETDNCGFRFAQECGIPMIETSHEISEIPGLRRFTEILARRFGDVVFHFHEDACVWRMA